MASLLIADDEKNILSGLRLAFEDEGYTVITASDGKEAWEKLQKNIVDLVITDLRMQAYLVVISDASCDCSDRSWNY